MPKVIAFKKSTTLKVFYFIFKGVCSVAKSIKSKKNPISKFEVWIFLQINYNLLIAFVFFPKIEC
jgi:hypothetical protein